MNTFSCTIFLLFAAVLSSLGVGPGKPSVLNFTRDHHKGGSNINSIFTDKRGLIYLGNTNGVIEFDGLDWTYVKHTQGSNVISMCPQTDTSALVVFNNTLARIFFSNVSFINLDTLINNQNFINTSNHFCFNNKLHYIKDNTLIALTNNAPKKLKSEVVFATGYKNSILTQDEHLDLQLVNGKEIVNIPSLKKRLIASYATAKTLFLLSESDIYAYNNNTLKHLYKAPNDIIFTSFVMLNANEYYVGTRSHGLLQLNEEFRLQKLIDSSDGLLNGSINKLKVDFRGNLWVGQSSGLSYVKTSSPFSIIGKKENIGQGNDSFEKDGILYLASNHGLYLSNFQNATFTLKKVPSINESVLKLTPFGNYLLAHGVNKTFILNIKTQNIIPLKNTYKDYYTSNDYIIALNSSTLSVFASIPKLVNNEPLYTTEFYYSKIHFTPDNKIWYLNQTTLEQFTITNTGILKNKAVTFENISGNILFSRGIPYVFNNDSCFKIINNTIVYNSKLNHLLKNPAKTINQVYTDKDSALWLLINGVPFKWNSKYFKHRENIFFNELRNQLSQNVNINQVYDSIMLIGSDNGFFCYNKNKLEKKHKFRTLIRKIENKQKQLSITFTNSFDSVPYHFVYINTPIKYANNDIAFTFSNGANDFEDSEFCNRLIGFEDDWTKWKAGNKREFTNLKPGKYTFAIVGRNNAFETGRSALVYFTILKPWYLRWWAISLYIVLLLGTFIFSLYTVTQKEKRKNQQLQEEQENEIIRLKNEKLESEIRNKSQELANSTMDLVKKNRFLTEVKYDIEEIETPEKQRIKYILRKINKEIEGKESQKLFEVNFDSVHENFIQQLKERHPILSTKDVRLCSYIRMGLSSKEIAPLLNITYRGVELSRYRLRAKLNINKGENMTVYIQNI